MQVGEQFQRQYYDILNKQPVDLYRFYTDHSRMTTVHIFENAPPKTSTVTGQKVTFLPSPGFTTRLKANAFARPNANRPQSICMVPGLIELPMQIVSSWSCLWWAYCK